MILNAVATWTLLVPFVFLSLSICMYGGLCKAEYSAQSESLSC